MSSGGEHEGEQVSTFKTETRAAADESAAKYDKTASKLASKYQAKKEEAKARAKRREQREHEQRADDEAEGTEEDEEDGPTIADRMVAGARHIPEAIQSSLQSASAAIRRRKTSELGGEKEAPSPPSRVVIDADDSGEQSAATRLKEALAELGKRTREASTDLFDNIRRLAAHHRTVTSVIKEDFQQRPCPQIISQCCTVLICKGLTVPSVFKTSTIPPEVVQKHMAQLGNSIMVSDNMDPRVAAAVIKHFLASLDDPLLCKKLTDEWIGIGADPTFVKLVLVDLPPANLFTLRLLMETCHRIAANSENSGMDAQAMATELVPVLLWRSSQGANEERGVEKANGDKGAEKSNEEKGLEKSNEEKPKRSNRDEDDLLVGSHLANTGGLPAKDPEEPSLSASEFEAVVRVIAHMITNFEDVFRKEEEK